MLALGNVLSFDVFAQVLVGTDPFHTDSRSGNADPMMYVVADYQGSFGCFSPEDIDPIAASLLNGAAPIHGGGLGAPMKTKANGACFMNGLVSAALNMKCSGEWPGDGPALALRAATVRIALAKFQDFMSPDGYLTDYQSGQLFDVGEHDRVRNLTGDQFPIDMPVEMARLYYLCAVRNITGPYSTCQGACLPWVAEVLGLKVRVVHPGVFCDIVLRCITLDGIKIGALFVIGNISLF